MLPLVKYSFLLRKKGVYACTFP